MINCSFDCLIILFTCSFVRLLVRSIICSCDYSFVRPCGAARCGNLVSWRQGELWARIWCMLARKEMIIITWLLLKAGDLNLPLEYEKFNFVSKSLIGIINQYFILEFYFQISGFNEFKKGPINRWGFNWVKTWKGGKKLCK